MPFSARSAGSCVPAAYWPGKTASTVLNCAACTTMTFTSRSIRSACKRALRRPGFTAVHVDTNEYAVRFRGTKARTASGSDASAGW